MPNKESRTRPGGRVVDVREAALTLFAARGYHGTSMKDIAKAVELRASSLYNHVSSKQDLLSDVMVGTMTSLLEAVRAAIATTDDPVLQLRRATEAHVRFHARHPREVRVGNHEIPALEQPHRSEVIELRRQHSRLFVSLIQRGVDDGVFDTRAPSLTAYAILQMGIGVSMWYRPNGPATEDDIVFQYGDMALRLVGIR